MLSDGAIRPSQCVPTEFWRHLESFDALWGAYLSQMMMSFAALRFLDPIRRSAATVCATHPSIETAPGTV